MAASTTPSSQIFLDSIPHTPPNPSGCVSGLHISKLSFSPARPRIPIGGSLRIFGHAYHRTYLRMSSKPCASWPSTNEVPSSVGAQSSDPRLSSPAHRESRCCSRSADRGPAALEFQEQQSFPRDT